MRTDKPNAPRFEVAFDGETTYRWQGKRWNARHAYAGPSNGGNLSERNAKIGCVWGDGDNRHEFPPAELMEFFPGYTRGRFAYTGTTHPCETTCGVLTIKDTQWETETTPQVEQTPRGLFAAAFCNELRTLGIAI